ncbi:MAG: hypothetical protein AVDCRST_MAG49-806, partial [uncultured Thermomicrobiales bacterium]
CRSPSASAWPGWSFAAPGGPPPRSVAPTAWRTWPGSAPAWRRRWRWRSLGPPSRSRPPAGANARRWRSWSPRSVAWPSSPPRPSRSTGGRRARSRCPAY